MTKHFAYGSNLWFEQMDRRCPDNEPIDKGKLKDYRWIISSRRYANIVESKGDYVIGYVYELNPKDEKKLDDKEGAGDAYTKEYLKIEVDGEEYECLVYIDRKRTTEGKPWDEYVTRINNGVKDSLSDEDGYVEKYIRKFIDAD